MIARYVVNILGLWHKGTIITILNKEITRYLVIARKNLSSWKKSAYIATNIYMLAGGRAWMFDTFQLYICVRTQKSISQLQSSFSNLSVTSPTSQLILQPFRRFTYVTTHSSTIPLLHLPYVTVHSPTLLSLLLRHKFFTILIHLTSCPCYKVRENVTTTLSWIDTRLMIDVLGHWRLWTIVRLGFLSVTSTLSKYSIICISNTL